MRKDSDIFVWDGSNLAYESETDAYYLYGTSLFAAKEGTTDRYYLFNGHGDVVQLANASGTVTKSYEYDAYGNEKNIDSSDTNHLRYCGEYYDTETGTYHLRARYYNPRLGRFTSEDTIKSGLNWYTYCAGNPITYVDPSGCELIISANGNDQTAILDILNQITDHILSTRVNDNGDRVVYVLEFCENDCKYTSGNLLITELINNTDFITVVEARYGKDPDVTTGPAVAYIDPKTGEIKYCNALIDIDPAHAPTIKVLNDTMTELVYEQQELFVALAHELIHAYRYMNGERYEKSTQNMLAYGYNMRVPTLLTKLGLSQRMRTELTRGEAQAEELLTVGITPFNDSYKWGDHYVRITENMIRAEHGIKERMIYGQ